MQRQTETGIIINFFPFFQDDDVHRTAGIDTVYLETTSFEMDEDDKRFLVKVMTSMFQPREQLYYCILPRFDSL